MLDTVERKTRQEACGGTHSAPEGIRTESSHVEPANQLQEMRVGSLPACCEDAGPLRRWEDPGPLGGRSRGPGFDAVRVLGHQVSESQQSCLYSPALPQTSASLCGQNLYWHPAKVHVSLSIPIELKFPSYREGFSEGCVCACACVHARVCCFRLFLPSCCNTQPSQFSALEHARAARTPS